MTQKKIRKPAPKKKPATRKPVVPKVPPGVADRVLSMEEKLERAKQARDMHAARANAATGQIDLLELLIKERDDAEKTLPPDPTE